MPPTITDHPPGNTAQGLCVGDFLLTGSTSRRFVSRAIKFGAWLRRFDREDRRFSHAALVIDEDGTLAEALAGGVKATHISKYTPANYMVVRTGVDRHDQEQVLRFARSVLTERARYGFATIVGLGIYCLTGAHLCIQRAGTAICSGFVSDALTRAGFVWPRPPFAMMPADLARYFKDELADAEPVATRARAPGEPVSPQPRRRPASPSRVRARR